MSENDNTTREVRSGGDKGARARAQERVISVHTRGRVFLSNQTRITFVDDEERKQ